MKKFFYVVLVGGLLLTASCGSDNKTNPNAPVAQQPGASLGNGWTQDQLQKAAEQCAAYGLLSTRGTRYSNWSSFCTCGYTAASSVATYDQFRSRPYNVLSQVNTQVNSCASSSGLSSGQKEIALETAPSYL